jgi:hypothetical protein
MWWMFRSLELFSYWLGLLAGRGLGAAGGRMAQHVPAGRPIDKLRTARRMSREQTELYNLYKRLLRYTDQAEETCNDLCWHVVLNVLNPTTDELLCPIVEASLQLCRKLLEDEGHFPIVEIDFTKKLPLGEIWDLSKVVRRQLAFYESQKHQQQIEEILRLILSDLLIDYRMGKLRISAEPDNAMFFVPLHTRHAHLANTIESIGQTLLEKCVPPDGEPCSHLMEILIRNTLVASGIDRDRLEQSHKQPVKPTQATGLSPAELIDSYLAGTPFHNFFYLNVPFTIPEKNRFEHMHIVAGSGHGKTQTLQNLILTDLSKIRDGERSVIVIDSQGDLLGKIQNLAALKEIAERLVIIDPTHIDSPPALNLFDFGLDRLHRYNSYERESLINGSIAMYEYVFGALLGAELTNRQRVIFRYLARLLMVVPGATIQTLLDFMQEPESVRLYLAKLTDLNTRRFFETEFFSRAFDDTRQQIRTRLWGILSNRVLARMFESKRNKVNLFESMNRGSLILISTAKDLLKQEGCEILGRFFIALIAQATQERASVSEEERTPTFVYIDEAHDYFDESIETLLVQARKYNVGICLSHQFLDQFDRRLHSAVKTNTAIKLVGGLSHDDAGVFANEMGCTRAFLQSMRKGEKSTQFACMVKNFSPPLCLTIPLGVMDDLPQINPSVLRDIFKHNRELYCRDATGEQDPPEPDTPNNDSPLGDPELL